MVGHMVLSRVHTRLAWFDDGGPLGSIVQEGRPIIVFHSLKTLLIR